MLQQFGPSEQQQLWEPRIHQEFCVYETTKYSKLTPLKALALPESEQCILYCTLEPDCFLTEYNPTNKICNMHSSITTCGNHNSRSYDVILSWKANFIPNGGPTDFCKQHALSSSIGYGGGCTALAGKTRQNYNDAAYYYKYGAISAVRLWKQGYFRAIQLR